MFDMGSDTPSSATMLRCCWVLTLLLLGIPHLCGADTGAESGSSSQVSSRGTELWRDVRQRAGSPSALDSDNPGIDLWGEIQQRNPFSAPAAGTSQVTGVDAGQLISPYGDQWRYYRSKLLLPYSGYIIGGMLVFVLVFYLVRGKVPIHAGPSKSKLLRYSLYERSIHWFTALSFLGLALTGLTLLYGRSLLLPWMGPEVFSTVASSGTFLHNVFGPLFALGVMLMFVKFVRRNIYQKGDLSWLLKGGGILGDKHVPSNFFNMGEKTMFWMLVIVGGGIIATGFILFFPSYGQGRVVMELSHVAHTLGAVVMITVVVGHIYIGSIGMEGALEGMKTGYCDLNWAREHHDWWAEQCEHQGKVINEQEFAALQARDDGSRDPVSNSPAGGASS